MENNIVKFKKPKQNVIRNGNTAVEITEVIHNSKFEPPIKLSLDNNNNRNNN
jgi:hypothetical protein